MSENENIFDKLISLKRREAGLDKPKDVFRDEPKRIRTLGNIDTIVESQRIFNPQLPPTNPAVPANQSASLAQSEPKGPPAKMVHTGTAGSTDLEGRWGTPTEKK